MIKILMLLIFLGAFNLDCLAQSVHSSLIMKHGLASNTVKSIVKDNSGFLWFGTNDGLSRFDGYEFRNYYYAPNLKGGEQNQSLAGNSIYAMLVDSAGNLWVGTTKGLSLYDPLSDNFSSDFLSAHIYDLKEDPKGNVWIASSRGLHQYQSAEGQLVDIELLSPQLQGQHIRSLVIEQDMLWFGTNTGLWSFAINQRRLTNLSELVYSDPLNQLTLTQGILQVSTMRHGLVCITLATLQRFDCVDDHALSGQEAVLSVVTSDGDVLLGMMGEGLFRLSAQKGLELLLPKLEVHDIYVDNTGLIWVGTSQGVKKIAPNSQHFSLLLSQSRIEELGGRVLSVYHDENITLAGTIKGFEIIALQQDPKLWQFPSDIQASQIFRASDGSYWFGSSQGLLYQGGHGIELLFAEHKNFLWGTSFYETEQHIWVGTKAAGIFKVDKQSKKFSPLQGDISQIPKTVVTLYPDRQNRLWIASFGGGLLRYNLSDHSIVTYRHDRTNPNSIINDNIKGIHQDRSGKIWLTTWGGLEMLDPDTGTFKHFSKSAGFPANMVLGMLADEEENLWLSTVDGLIKFNLVDHKVEVFDQSDGMPENPSFSIGTYFRDVDSGVMYFGGKKLITFDPKRLAKSTLAPTTRMVEVNLNGQDISYDWRFLDAPVYQAAQLTAEYPIKQLSFRFSSLAFSEPGRDQYKYQLLGYQPDWQAAPLRFAAYSNLWPGDYVFKVKSRNKDGVWDQQGVQLRLKIEPPWWLTNWGYLLYLLSGLGFVYGIVKWRTWVILKRAVRLEGLVIQRTNTISHLLQQKERLFTHVSHEFRTPLTLILRAVEHYQKGAKTEQEQLINASAQYNISRLIQMVEQLLDLARFNSGAKPEPVSIALNTFCGLIVNGFDSAVATEQHQIEVDIAADIAVWVEEDAMEKIVVNLLSNAIKFSPAGGLIRISATIEQGKVLLVIQDQGAGISVADQAVIFEPFIRGQQSSHSIAGTGLGLAMVKELVEAHQGSIWLQSTLHHGSKFYVQLPQAPIQEKQYQPLKTYEFQRNLVEQMNMSLNMNEPPEVSGTDKKSQHKLLIIEDNPQMLEYLHSLFCDDFDCLLAQDGNAGLHTARSDIPDLILSDVMMPKIDGIALTRVLKQDMRTSHIPIVLLTARGDRHCKLDGLRALANDHITKPFDEMELKLKLNNQLRFRDLLIEHLAARERNHEDVDVVDISLNKVELEFKAKLDGIIEQGYSDSDFKVAEIAKALFITPKQLQRKLKGLFGLTPTEYLRQFRLKKAASLLEQGHRPSDVAIEVGFGAYTYFSSCFQALFGLSPKQYQMQDK